jgi:hypothetical protein
MQGKVRGSGDRGPGQNCLKLGPRLQSLHGSARYARGQQKLDSQALAAFGAACVDHGTAATGLHANQKTMGTGATDFGRLVSAFHLEFLTGSVLIPLFKRKQTKEDLGLIAPNTIRGTADYRKFSEQGQHLTSNTPRNAVSSVLQTKLWIRV